MDLVILVILILIVVFIFRRFSSFIYFIGIVDILLRLLSFFASQIPIYAISHFIQTYIPANIPSMLMAYSAGVLETILIWLYVIAMCIFEYYLITYFIRRK